MSDPSHWWGVRKIEPGRAAGLRIGPLALDLERRDRDWRVGFESLGDPLEARVERGEPQGDLASIHRVVARAGDHLRLAPACADRAVISRPEHPFHLPGGGSVTVYVGSPVWLQLALEPLGQVILDIPISRPADTWFGPLTGAGELCYASRTVLRLDPANVVRRPHRALTEVEIVNRAEEPLDLEYLRLPVQHLSLYVDGGGRLWTDRIRLVRSRGDDFAAIEIGRGAGGGRTLVTGPRLPPPKGFVARAFSGLLHMGLLEH